MNELIHEPSGLARCPACAEPADTCQGHGPIGDHRGFLILAQHDRDNHEQCHPRGCAIAAAALQQCMAVHPAGRKVR